MDRKQDMGAGAGVSRRVAPSKPSKAGGEPVPPRERIGKLLTEAGLITAEQLEQALARQRVRGGKLAQNLISLDYLDSRRFMEFLSDHKGLASIDLDHYCLPAECIKLIPADFARKHEVVPIDKMGNDLTLAMACPLDTDTVAELRQMTGLKIRPLLVSVDAVRGVLDRCYPASSVYDGPDGTLPAPSQIAPPPSRGPLPGVSSALAMENILSLVRSVQSLPALPEVVRRLREMIAKPDTTTKEVANEIAKDPALTAKVLSLANSSAYYLVQPVDSVPLATALLGLREIYHVVLSAVVMDQFSGSRHFDYAGFWRQARFCATAARILAKARGQKSADGVFSAGLLHDLGRLVLAELVPERYGQVGTHLPDEELLARESELFGIAHPEVGYVLASEWGLPEEIAAPVRFHHQPAYAREHRELVALVTLATGIFRLREGQSSDTASLLAGEHPEALELLQLTEQQLDVVVSVLKELSADDLA